MVIHPNPRPKWQTSTTSHVYQDTTVTSPSLRWPLLELKCFPAPCMTVYEAHMLAGLTFIEVWVLASLDQVADGELSVLPK